MDGFSWNFIYDDFSKPSWEYSSFITIRQEEWLLYEKNCENLWKCCSEYFLEWEMFQESFVEKIEAHFMSNIFLNTLRH